MMSDIDPYLAGKLSGNTLCYCGLQARAKQAGDRPAVVTCNEMRKTSPSSCHQPGNCAAQVGGPICIAVWRWIAAIGSG